MSHSISHSDYLRLMGIQEWQSRQSMTTVCAAEPTVAESAVGAAALTVEQQHIVEPVVEPVVEQSVEQVVQTKVQQGVGQSAEMDTQQQIIVPVVTKALKVDEVISKAGKPCPLCIEKNVIQFQTVVNGRKWFCLVSAFGYQGQFSLEDEAGRLLLAMLAAVKSSGVNAEDVRVMSCEDVPDQNCAEWVALQIKHKTPDLVLVMGLSLSRLLLMSREPRADLPVDLSGGNFDLMGLPLIATHHPAEMLADASLKRQVWTDLKRGLAL